MDKIEAWPLHGRKYTIPQKILLFQMLVLENAAKQWLKIFKGTINNNRKGSTIIIKYLLAIYHRIKLSKIIRVNSRWAKKKYKSNNKKTLEIDQNTFTMFSEWIYFSVVPKTCNFTNRPKNCRVIKIKRTMKTF